MIPSRIRLTLATSLALGLLGTGAAALATQPAKSEPERTQAAPSAAFKHPGVLVGKGQLDFVRTKVQAGSQPWKSAYDAMRTSRYASLSWKPRPRADVECGSGSNPNHGCSDERDDALAAYTDALMWTVTGDKRYAKKSIEIMDAWSATIKRHSNSNAPLQTGWAGASFSRAAEIVRHTNGGWPASRVDRFKKVLREVYLPILVAGQPNKNGNWELIMTDAAMGIAVFLDDRTSFDKAVKLWRGRLPAYVYLKSDGDLPKPPPGGNKNTKDKLIAYWQGQKVFADGLAQETCRDFGHTGWGLDAAVHAAETARLQGVDLYKEGRARLTKALEFHAAYELGATAPSWLCGGTLHKGLGPTQEIVFNHYHGRLGVAMPKTQKLVEARRPAGANYFLAWETLTHAGTP
ncbi:alginate lyase family protein [Wenjunlia tyrosinilytica]|nr:alginate lyase family protein [Wenjunlia tyrosinilytica]